jgi:hypothetical protein
MRVILAILASILAGPTMHLGEVSAAPATHHQSHETHKALPSASAACPMVCCPCLPETLALAPPVSVAYLVAAVPPPPLMTRSLPPLDRPPRA